MLEKCDRALDRVARGEPQVHHPAGEALIRFHGLRLTLLDAGDLRPAKDDIESLTQFVDDLVLQRKDIGDAAIDFYSAPDGARTDVQKICRDPDQFADLLESANDDPGRPEAAADVDGERIVHAGVRAEVPERVVHARSTDDGQSGDVIKVGADGHRDAGADTIVGE